MSRAFELEIKTKRDMRAESAKILRACSFPSRTTLENTIENYRASLDAIRQDYAVISLAVNASRSPTLLKDRDDYCEALCSYSIMLELLEECKTRNIQPPKTMLQNTNNALQKLNQAFNKLATPECWMIANHIRMFKTLRDEFEKMEAAFLFRCIKLYERKLDQYRSANTIIDQWPLDTNSKPNVQLKQTAATNALQTLNQAIGDYISQKITADELSACSTKTHEIVQAFYSDVKIAFHIPSAVSTRAPARPEGQKTKAPPRLNLSSRSPAFYTTPEEQRAAYASTPAPSPVS